MASIKEMKLKNGTTSWKVTIRVTGHPTMWQSFSTEEEAQQFALETDAKLGAKNYHRRVPVSKQDYLEMLRRTRVVDLIRKWEKQGKYSKHALRCLESACEMAKTSTVEQIGGKWLESIVARFEVKGKKRGKPYNWNTIRSRLAVVKQAIQWECQVCDLECPPFPSVDFYIPPHWTDKRERRLASDEESRLYDQISNRKNNSLPWKMLVTLALETGARLQEMVLMEWCELSLDDQVWTIPKNHCKTRVTRHVVLSEKAREVIQTLREHKVKHSSRLFHTIRSPLAASQAFWAITRDSKIEDLHFHDLRHEAISRMVASGKHSTEMIMHMTGHNDIKSHRRYTHIQAQELLEMSQRSAKDKK